MRYSVTFLVPLALSLAFATAAHSTTLALSPMDASFGVGDSVEMEVLVSGLGDAGAPSLGAFDLELSYDSTLLQFDALDFGSFGSSMLDLSGFGSVQYFDAGTPGTLIFGEISFDDPGLLDSSQPGSFLIARMYFTTLGPGVANIQFDSVFMADSNGDLFAADSLFDSSISISAVPVPGALLLLVSGLLGLLPVARRRRPHPAGARQG